MTTSDRARVEWFERQMYRLYDCRGLKPNPGQMAEYWRLIGDRRFPKRPTAPYEFEPPEIAAAFDQAMEQVAIEFGIWSSKLLVGFCIEQRRRQRGYPPPPPLPLPAQRSLDRAEPPPDVVRQGRHAILRWYLGPPPGEVRMREPGEEDDEP